GSGGQVQQGCCQAQPYWLGFDEGELYTYHKLPSYSPNVAALHLDYQSASANARPIFMVHYPIDSSQAVPPTVSAQLTLNSTAGQLFYYTTNGGATNPGDIMQIALQGDATSLSTGRYSYSIAVTANYGTPVTTTYTGSVDIINSSSSPFGAGWSLNSLYRIWSVTGGVILEQPVGTSLWFASTGSGTFTTPV